MKVNEARRCMYELSQLYFKGATVMYAGQSHAVKPVKSLVTLSTVSMSRPLNPPTRIIDGHPVAYYPTKMGVQVDLYTKGAPVSVQAGNLVPMENTALEDLTEFANFVNSAYVINWCHERDIALLPVGNVRDTTSLINNSSYQYRATLEFSLCFTEKAIGYAGILDPDSIRHNTPEGAEGGNDLAEDVYIAPTFTPSASGGGSDELAKESIGYFTSAEIKEEHEIGQ